VFDEGASSVEVKFFEYFVDFDRVNFSASILIKDKESVSETFIIGGADSFSPSNWDRFFGFLFSLGLSTHEEIGTFIHCEGKKI
jgi:hypothetical protein